MEHKNSALTVEHAKQYMPGGVSSGLRSVGIPLAFVRAKGSHIIDADNNEYIDYHCGFGPVILGHCNPIVNSKVFETLESIDLMGVGVTEQELKLADKICHHVPSARRTLFCNSGSEATYHAIRLSRAVTKRKEIIKFQGCYHGWHDYVAMNVISPKEKIGTKDPLSSGMLEEAVESTHVLPFNDLDRVEQKVRERHDKIAAIILEPIPHNIGCVLPKMDFLKGLREIASHYDIILIFDEVVTGFRHNIGGYQKICGVTPDLTTLGKSLANGYPIAAICGREDLMNRFSSGAGDVFFAGTYNGHPAMTAAGLATIEQLESGEIHKYLFSLGDEVRSGLQELSEKHRLKTFVTGFGSIFVTYFLEPPVESYTDLLRNDKAKYVEFNNLMIENGVFMLPLNLKRNSISAAHNKDDIETTLRAADKAMYRISSGP